MPRLSRFGGPPTASPKITSTRCRFCFVHESSTLQLLLGSYAPNTVAMPQDMPPTGGYEPVQYRRNLPARGFRPATYLVAIGVVVTYGFWRVGQGIREHKYVYPEERVVRGEDTATKRTERIVQGLLVC